MSKITRDFRVSALRRGIVVHSRAENVAPANIINASVIEMANLGFIVTPDNLENMSINDLEDMINDARKIIGSDRDMTPIYPGFPKQVEELDTLVLLVEQILHYWTGGEFLPNYPTVAREGLPLEDMLNNAREVTVLSAGEAARHITRELVTNPVALSDDDKILLESALELHTPSLSTIVDIMKNSRNGENKQFFIKAVNNVSSFTANEIIIAVTPTCDNNDQLLRVILALATIPSHEKWESNYKLAVNNLADRHNRAVKMLNISRPARRAILTQLGKTSTGFKADSLVTRQNLWRGIMRGIHPYDFSFTEAQKRAVDIIHSNVEYRTLNSLVEEAMNTGNIIMAVKLLADNQPGNLLRRIVALLRLVKSNEDATVLAEAITRVGVQSTMTTLISAHNGVISANDDNARVTRVAGLNNTMINRKKTRKVSNSHVLLTANVIKTVLKNKLKELPAPTSPVHVTSTVPVPLVKRDASTTDRILDRGQELTLPGNGNVLRVFGHWNNNQSGSGYMDIGVTVLGKNFEPLGVCTWNAWGYSRDWATYSGDCLVHPGDSAAEFIDVKLKKVRQLFPTAKWVAMTVQSWSGWPMKNVDFIAGAMLRSDADAGETFDARTVVTAFKPTTGSTQSVPLAVNLETGKMVWIDSSNGSTAGGVSSINDSSVGSIVYDEIVRPRLSMGELATLWAEAHDVPVVDEPVDREQILKLLA